MSNEEDIADAIPTACSAEDGGILFQSDDITVNITFVDAFTAQQIDTQLKCTRLVY